MKEFRTTLIYIYMFVFEGTIASDESFLHLQPIHKSWDVCQAGMETRPPSFPRYELMSQTAKFPPRWLSSSPKMTRSFMNFGGVMNQDEIHPDIVDMSATAHNSELTR